MERLEKIFISLILGMMFTTWCFIMFGLFSVVNAEEIYPELDITAATVIVNWYDTEEELQDALGDSELGGYSECEWRPEFNISFCELWLVRPTELDTWTNNPEQDKWKTMGHEFYHALEGGFHDE